MPFNYSALSAGEHAISVVVTDRLGDRIEHSATFEVVRFEQSFLYKENTPNMNWSMASSYANYITVRGIEVSGSAYTVTLRWQTMTQSFEIINIVKHYHFVPRRGACVNIGRLTLLLKRSLNTSSLRAHCDGMHHCSRFAEGFFPL